MRRLVVSALMLAAVGCLGPRVGPALPSWSSAPRQLRVQVVDRGTVEIKDVALEDYVRATALSEFAPAAEEPRVAGQMLEVQAVISRTYAVAHLGRHAREGFDLCGTTHCQLFDPARLATSRWSAAALEAVHRTAGTVVWFEVGPAETLFHADCGGHTSAASAVWGGENPPYLLARADAGAAREAHAAWEYRIDVDSVHAALDLDPRTRSGARLRAIEVVARDTAGRAERIGIHGETTVEVRGEVLRQVLTRRFGPGAIRSTRLDIRREGATIVFAGRGYGHGVGLCQAGALARLRAGATPANVLGHYYPGTRLHVLGFENGTRRPSCESDATRPDGAKDEHEDHDDTKQSW